MVAFVFGSEERIEEEFEDFLKEMIGLVEIKKHRDNLWLLVFEDKESAINAQMLLELNGVHGI